MRANKAIHVMLCFCTIRLCIAAARRSLSRRLFVAMLRVPGVFALYSLEALNPTSQCRAKIIVALIHLADLKMML